MTVPVHERVHEPVVSHHLPVIPQRSRRLTTRLLHDQEAGELGNPGRQQPPAGARQDSGGFTGVLAEQQFHVLAAQPAFADEPLVDGVLRQLGTFGQPEVQRHVQPGQELRLRRHGGAEPGGVPGERAAARAGVPGQHVQQPPDRGQPVLVGDRVAIVRRAVPQPLDVAQRLDHRPAADVRPARGDQILERLARRASGHLVMPPQLLEQPLGDLPDPGDRVLRVPVAEGADRPLEVQAEVAGDPDVVG